VAVVVETERMMAAGSTTWPPTPAGSASAPTATPPRSRSSGFAAGGPPPAATITHTPDGCWSPPTRMAPTATVSRLQDRTGCFGGADRAVPVIAGSLRRRSGRAAQRGPAAFRGQRRLAAGRGL